MRHSLDFRSCDRAAVEALTRGVSAFDGEALGRICHVVRQRVLEPGFRGGAGRMDWPDWGSGLVLVASAFEERLRRGNEPPADMQEALLDFLLKWVGD